MTKKYVIQDPTNNQWYTENHNIPASDRWSPNFLDAYQHDTLSDAENEISNDADLSEIFYRIIEITKK